MCVCVSGAILFQAKNLKNLYLKKYTEAFLGMGSLS